MERKGIQKKEKCIDKMGSMKLHWYFIFVTIYK